jgi:hypothetical protein
MQIDDLPVCPPHVSKFVYYLAIWTMQSAYISMMHDYAFTTMLLVGASGTYTLCKSGCNNQSIRHIDKCMTIAALSAKSYIIFTEFPEVCKYVWVTHLGITCVASSMNELIVKMEPIRHVTEHEMAHNDIYYITTYMQMFFIHLLPTISFTLCLIISNHVTYARNLCT